jgi:uncharacterized protein YjiS (DUF1127 family)
MFLSIVVSGLRRWLRFRETARQLNALSDRELSDIGIARQDIAQVGTSRPLKPERSAAAPEGSG